MKNLTLLVFLVVLLASTTVLANSDNVKNELIEKNLIAGLQSENVGLVTSSAYYLGEYGSSKSIIPLLKVLKSGDTEEERISAAVALSKINTGLARFAVKRRAKFDDSERVRNLCDRFYQESLQKIK